MERLIQMPYLWLIWVLVLFTCYMFVTLDRRSALGKQQCTHGLSFIIVLALYNAEMHSIGYYTIWVLGAGNLVAYWIIKLLTD